MAYVPAPGYQPVYNPTLPYNKPIPGGLSVGMSIYIQGVAKDHMKRFFVNFVAGHGSGEDIAFHFNPRFDGWDKVVFNSYQGGKWGKEEKKRSMPFHKGTPFELVFMVLTEHYKVVVNGDPFYEFGHRMPLQMVTHLLVDGDLELQSINFIGGPPAPNQVTEQPAAKHPAYNGGTPNLQPGDLALHINPRPLEGVLVRNSYLNGSWGSEERKISYNPFGPGQFFDVSLGSLPPFPPKPVSAPWPQAALSLQLSVRCGIDRFKVFANGQHLFDFSHRLSAFQKVDMLEIQGDVTLSYVQV
ncbi:hypothetical protein MC885_013935 [Smutsia gigantea]|nr:hypothetical protein MC885_013935 [Smutsia gigantea]